MDYRPAFISLILLMNIKDSLTLERLPVTCEHKNICAVRETSVTLRCSYATINTTSGFWFSHKQRKNWREKDEAEDLTLDSDYSGRVKQVITMRQSDLTIKNVSERDSGEYQLMFIMKNGSKSISSVSVNLTVTDKPNEVKMSMETQITIVMLSMILTFAVIGVLAYRFLRRRKCSSSQNRDNKVQPCPPLDNAAPQSTVAEFTHQTEEQNLHYSSVSFKQSNKSKSSTPTVIYSSAEDIHYATVKLK